MKTKSMKKKWHDSVKKQRKIKHILKEHTGST